MKDFSIFLNRLKKNQKRLKPYLKQHQIEAYRLYDRDIPEYPYIVDIYGQHIVVFERGKKLEDEALRQRHQNEIHQALREFLPDLRIIFKTRQRQSGKEQYEKNASLNNFFTIKEGSAKFRINITDYLDCGLFLDHRPLRQQLLKFCKGKKVLNLFCYTGALSVAAALGGAEVTSVDMSNTYLDWAKENFKLNKIPLDKHEFIRADILSWVNSVSDQFDLILLDPPSFSNSKKMEEAFNIQDQHPFLIESLLHHIKDDGRLFFSTNFKKFSLAPDLSEKWDIRETTHKTIPQDFRDQKIHYSYLIKKPLHEGKAWKGFL